MSTAELQALPEGIRPEYVPYLERIGLPIHLWSQFTGDMRAIICCVFDGEQKPRE